MTASEINEIMGAIGELKGMLSGVNTAIGDIKTNINELYEDRNELRDDLTALKQAHEDRVNAGNCGGNNDTTTKMKFPIKAISVSSGITLILLIAILLLFKYLGLLV